MDHDPYWRCHIVAAVVKHSPSYSPREQPEPRGAANNTNHGAQLIVHSLYLSSIHKGIEDAREGEREREGKKIRARKTSIKLLA